MRRAVATGWLLIACTVASAACKTDKPDKSDKPREEPRPAPPRAVAPPPTERPALPPAGSAAAGSSEKLEIAHVKEIAPTFKEATPLTELWAQEQFGQARASLCMSGTDAAAIGKQMAGTLAAAGWDAVSSRADPKHAAMSANLDGVRISITVGGRDAKCRGTVANILYSGAHPTVPPLEPGDRVH